MSENTLRTRKPALTLSTATKLAAARLWAAEHYPYFATALYALTWQEREGHRGVTADARWRLTVDPDVVAEHTVEELGTTLLHLLSHLLRDHATRAEEQRVNENSRDRWSVAADLEVDDDFVDQTDIAYVTTPALPQDYGFETGQLAETYFTRIPAVFPTSSVKSGDTAGAGKQEGAEGPTFGGSDDDPDRAGPGTPQGCGSASHGLPDSWEADSGGAIATGLDADEAEIVRNETAHAIRETLKQRGTVHGGWAVWAEATLEPQVDWRRVLSAEIRRGVRRAVGRADFTFAKRSRRSSALKGVILPGVFAPAPELAIVVDTSGSMGARELAAALTEIDGILQRSGLAVRRVPVLACDTEVGALTQASRSDQVVLRGGGGTDMVRGIEAAVRLRPKPQLVIVLTDGYTPWPAKPPKGITVVAGLIGPCPEPPPAWIRSVGIEVAA